MVVKAGEVNSGKSNMKADAEENGMSLTWECMHDMDLDILG